MSRLSLARDGRLRHLSGVPKPLAGKDRMMRDEMDARLWVDHHEAFSDGVDRALAALRSALGRFAGWDGTSHQLLALIASFALTALTFQSTAA
jgi:hypothetical protein